MFLVTAAAMALAEPSVLVFSKTAAFRHDSIPVAVKAVSALKGIKVTATEDARVFTPESLAKFDAVVFLLTTGDVLNDDQQRAFEHWHSSGGGYVGVHAASDTEYDWEFYGKTVGAYFKTHPAIARATLVVEDRSHPATKSLPENWERTDEWYEFRSNPRQNVHVLVRIDGNSYPGGTGDADHPMVWWHDRLGGRAFYTALGHTAESYQEPMFMDMVLNAIVWCAKGGATR